MMLRKWEELPLEMQTDEVREYYDIISRKRIHLLIKRIFDIVLSLIMLVLFLPVFLVIAAAIKLDSAGPVFYRQTRITQYNETFRIIKFRSMAAGAGGPQVTLGNDARITRVGQVIRKYRLDELSQLLNVLAGTMTFVGTRPEVPRYVAEYTPEMMATLLLPAGVTSLASIYFKDEAEILEAAANAEQCYTEEILPQKMRYNLKALREFSLWADIRVMFMTVCAVCGKEYKCQFDKPTEKAGELTLER